MAETAGDLTTALSRRIRDPNNTAHTAADIRTILTHCQRIVNTHTRAVLVEVDVTQSAGTVIDTTLNYALLDRVDLIRVDDENLRMVPWDTLKYHSPYWLKSLAHAPRVWAPIGRMLFAVWPGAALARSVTAVGPKITTALTATSTATELRDQHMPAILNLAEQILLMRHRLFASVEQIDARRKVSSKAGNV